MNSGAAFKKKTFLVVEDDPSSRMLMKHLLGKLDIEVVAAETGEEALEIVNNQPVEGMLLDIALGAGIDGLELGEKLKADQRFQKTPMVAVTAYEQKLLGDIAEKGFTGYLHKPYSARELGEMLAKQEQRKKGQRLIL